jgi:hypothetical protein
MFEIRLRHSISGTGLLLILKIVSKGNTYSVWLRTKIPEVWNNFSKIECFWTVINAQAPNRVGCI